jgi:hypothetical protein
VTVVGVKNRWKTPTSGGWSDTLLTFFFVDDPAHHICEVCARFICGPTRFFHLKTHESGCSEALGFVYVPRASSAACLAVRAMMFLTASLLSLLP